MRKAGRFPALVSGIILTAALVSGCDENEEDPAPNAEETADALDDDQAEPEDLDEDEDAADPEESDDDADPVAEEEPQDAAGWVAFGDCPIDVPEPATSYEVVQEMPVDGVEVFCTIEVNADGDVETHWDDLAAAFSDEGASQVEDNPANDATDPNDISIQAWTLEDYEVIVNMRANDADSTNLIYVVRDTERQG